MHPRADIRQPTGTALRFQPTSQQIRGGVHAISCEEGFIHSSPDDSNFEFRDTSPEDRCGTEQKIHTLSSIESANTKHSEAFRGRR